MPGWVTLFCLPPVLFGIGLAWAAGPAVRLGGRWRFVRRGILAATAVALIGPAVAAYQVTVAMAAADPAAAEDRAVALAMAISEALNLGAFILVLGLLGQATALGFVIAGRLRARRE